MKEKYNITGMTCSACSSRVEREVGKLDGIKELTVNLLTNSMSVEYDGDKLKSEDIVKTVEKAGYGASLQSEKTVKTEKKGATAKNIAEENIKNFKMRLAVSFAFLLPLMYISMGHMWGAPLPAFLSGHKGAVSFAFTQFLLCLPVIAVNYKYFTHGFKTLFSGSPNMDSLIAVGSSASLIYGIFAIYRMAWGMGTNDMALVEKYHMDLYFESAAMILALITLGKFLETKSKGKTSEALSKLLDMAPKTAIVLKNGEETVIPVEEVEKGDILIVKPGAAIPVDGIVTEGVTSVDEAAITGESIPVHKEMGSKVIGATVNKNGYIKMQATKVGEDTTFSQIVKLVEEASATKAPIAKLADKIAGVFVPVVMTIALITAVVWLVLGADFEFALSSAITVLVISCPCALGLATPVAIMVGTGKGAENGILIKSGEALERLHSVDTVVFDKTGTITEGKPQVTDVKVFGSDREAFLKIAAGLESKSEHPLAEAVCAYTAEENINPVEFSQFTSVPGKGIKAQLDKDTYIAGNQKLLEESGIDFESCREHFEKLASEGKTPLIFAKNRDVIGIIAVADTVKPTSKEAIELLKGMGIDSIMLTGDNRRTAEGIAKALPLKKVIAEVLPQDKENHIASLQKEGKCVVMVGDGINDAPALTRADVGIAIGAGTDIAMESSDVVLIKNDLLDAVTAIKLSKAVIRNIKQNLFWAFFYNCLGIPIAAGVFYNAFGLRLTPMFGAAAMSMSSVFVVTNALRLKKFKVLHGDKSTSKTENKKYEVKTELLPVISSKEENNTKEDTNMVVIKIEGMMCMHCVKHVTEALQKIASDVEVSLENKEARVKASKEQADALAQAVRDAGYDVVSLTAE